MNSVQVINTLSIISAVLVTIQSCLLFSHTRDSFFIGLGTLAGISFLSLLLLNELGITCAARVLFLAIHQAVAVSLAIGKGAVVGEAILAAFLIIVTLLVFTRTWVIVTCISLIISCLVTIKINFHTGFINPVPERGLQSIRFFKECCATSLFILITVGVSFFKRHVLRLIEALKKSNTELQQALKEKSMLAQFLSHEIRNPLHSMAGITEVMTREISGKDEYNPLMEYMQDLNASSSYAMSVVNNVLELETAERQTCAPEVFAPTDWLQGIVKSFQYQASHKQVALVFVSGDDIPSFISSPKNCLNKIVINLIINAIKFTRENSVVSITLSRENERLSIRVQDRGMGMSKEKKERIFNLYETEKNEFLQGSGIGLYVANNLTKAIGGSLSLESEENKGTTFILEWPMQEAAAPTMKVVSTLTGFDGLKVLAVDDDTFSQKYLKRYFDDTGIHIRQAFNGADGLKICRDWQPDLLLLDVFLGDMTGHEFLEHVHALSPDTHVIIISGTSSDGEEQRFLDAGADHYLLKPLPKRALCAAIENVMRSESAAAI
ncbi:ATP-binding protein [Chitinophaga sp.]|uniref:ATP-binding response regulator n=1 Tax=Chitinophaga sp. TaxID=1869181 RepID=UPI0025C47672|nr:ATP-binding protein [Chitinophaga sp.]